MGMVRLSFLIFVLIAANATAACWQVVYNTSDGSLVSVFQLRTCSENPSGVTTTPEVAFRYFVQPPPTDLQDAVGRYRYRYNGTTMVKLNAAGLDALEKERLYDQYEGIIQRLVRLEKALELHPGNAKIVARRDAVLVEESVKWSEITAP